MMKYVVSIALVAVVLQVNARPNKNIMRRNIQNNEVDAPVEFEVKAPWHGHADEGYPGFDGNPYKQSLVELSAMLASIAGDALQDEDNVPSVIKSIVKGAQKTSWKSFEEYLDYWGAAQNALMAEIEKEQQKVSAPVKRESNYDEEDNDNDVVDDGDNDNDDVNIEDVVNDDNEEYNIVKEPVDKVVNDRVEVVDDDDDSSDE